MTHYRYLIVGGGMTAAAAVEGIREIDSHSSIGLISAEPDFPYNRPPLSKALWKGADLQTIWRKVDQPGVEVHLGRVIREILPMRKRVVDDRGNFFTYKSSCSRPAEGRDDCRLSMTASSTFGPWLTTGVSANPVARADALP